MQGSRIPRPLAAGPAAPVRPAASPALGRSLRSQSTLDGPSGECSWLTGLMHHPVWPVVLPELSLQPAAGQDADHLERANACSATKSSHGTLLIAFACRGR